MTSRRDAIMDALLAYLQAQCGDTFKSYSRRFLTWEQMVQDAQATGQRRPAVKQPALFLFDGVGLGGGTDTFQPRGRGSPGTVVLGKTIVIYARLPGGGTSQGPDGLTPGGVVFNPLIEAVEDAMAQSDSPSQGTLTLGNLVSHVWLEGAGMMMTGELDETDGQGMLTLPISILMWPRNQ